MAASKVRRVPICTFGDDYPLRLAYPDADQHTESRPPPVHEPNFAERYHGAMREMPLSIEDLHRANQAHIAAVKLFRNN